MTADRGFVSTVPQAGSVLNHLPAEGDGRGRKQAGSPSATLFDQLEARGLLSTEDRHRVQSLMARERGAQGRTDVVSVLTQIGAVTEQALAEALADICDAPLMTPSDWPEWVPDADHVPVSRRFLERVGACPVAVTDTEVTLAMADPGDAATRTALETALHKPIRIRTATPSEIRALLGRTAPMHNSPERWATEQAAPLAAALGHADAGLLRDKASEAPVLKAADRLLEEALERRASDIHVEPARQGVKIRLRIDGRLVPLLGAISVEAASLISRLKLIGGLDIAERRLPQDGRVRAVIRGHQVDLRLATAPTLYGEALSIRLLDKSQAPLSLDKLGYDPETRALLERLFAHPDGLIVVAGPTGSGKTTTLYAALALLADGTRKIMTIEDPVEYSMEGISQIQVQAAISLTFAKALRSVLRHDPDIILVGEIRDRETAEIAVQAALTGHLVLATLHTRSAAGTVTRLQDMGIADYLLSATLLGVIAQRLVRRGPEGRAPDSGTQGRLAICEILTSSPRIRTLIDQGASAETIEAAARRDGMRSLAEDGARKVADGLTSADEIRRATAGDL